MSNTLANLAKFILAMLPVGALGGVLRIPYLYTLGFDQFPPIQAILSRVLHVVTFIVLSCVSGLFVKGFIEGVAKTESKALVWALIFVVLGTIPLPMLDRLHWTLVYGSYILVSGVTFALILNLIEKSSAKSTSMINLGVFVVLIALSSISIWSFSVGISRHLPWFLGGASPQVRSYLQAKESGIPEYALGAVELCLTEADGCWIRYDDYDTRQKRTALVSCEKLSLHDTPIEGQYSAHLWRFDEKK